IARPADAAARGAQLLEQRPVDVAGSDVVSADQRFGERRLTARDRADNRPSFAGADRPGEDSDRQRARGPGGGDGGELDQRGGGGRECVLTPRHARISRTTFAPSTPDSRASSPWNLMPKRS